MHCRIEPSEPLTFVLSPFVRGEAKNATPGNAEIVHRRPALSNVVLFVRCHFSKPGQRWRPTLGLNSHLT